MENRVVITGIGVILPIGCTEQEILFALENDNVFFESSEFFRNVIISPVINFDFRDYVKTYKFSRYLPRSWKFSICAAKKAIEDAKLSSYILENSSLFVGSGPNVDVFQMDIEQKALGILSILPNTPSFCISNLFNIHGENLTISTACSSSLQSIGEGFLRIKNGHAKVAICGGGDSRLSKSGLQMYYNAKVLRLKSELDDPKNIYSPFDKKNIGFVPGEGGAFFVLEELSYAKNRKAKIYGEILGYSSSMDGINPTAPDTSAYYAEICVKNALLYSKLTPDHIDIIFSHGTGTELNDTMEINIFKKLFICKKPYVTALKSWIGHLAAGCGAAEMAIGIFCLNNNIIPKIRNLQEPRDDSIPFVLENITHELDTAIFQSFGFGGQNACIVYKRSVH